MAASAGRGRVAGGVDRALMAQPTPKVIPDARFLSAKCLGLREKSGHILGGPIGVAQTRPISHGWIQPEVGKSVRLPESGKHANQHDRMVDLGDTDALSAAW
jgi:hypothetical protein